MTWRVEEGDCREALRAMPEASVHCCLTSPPYWGLRDYGLAPTAWGGDPGCEHEWEVERVGARRSSYDGLEALGERHSGGGHTQAAATEVDVERGSCRRCGAWLGCLGLEPTPELYVEHLVEVMREVRRVLRPDGTLWLNLGDSYANPGHYKGDPGSHGTIGRPRQADQEGGWTEGQKPYSKTAPGLKNKDLVGVPWLAALALRADGWWLRAEVVWSKRNALPESVGDRPNRTHEQVFLLAPSERYFYDHWAVREESSSGPSDVAKMLDPDESRELRHDREDLRHSTEHAIGRRRAVGDPSGRNMRTVWEVATQAFPGAHFAVFPTALAERPVRAGTSARGACPECGAPWRRAVERRVPEDPGRSGDSKQRGADGLSPRLASSAERQLGAAYQRQLDENPPRTVGWYPTCACGAPEGVLAGDLEPILSPTGARLGDGSLTTGRRGFNRERHPEGGTRPMTRYQQRAYAAQLRALGAAAREAIVGRVGVEAWNHYVRTDRSGARPLPPDELDRLLEAGTLERVEPPDWDPPEPVPCVVLDPFCGAGTAGLVAVREGRSFVGVDLSPEYAAMARGRIAAWEANPNGHLTGDPEPIPGQLALGAA